MIFIKERGLHGVSHCISDGHRGIKKAVEDVFPDCTWQNCQAHVWRNILNVVPKEHKEDAAYYINHILTAPCRDSADNALLFFISKYKYIAPKAVKIIQSNYESVTATLELEPEIRVVSILLCKIHK